MPDSHDADHDTVRHHCLWGALMGGATGVEWYFGYRYPHNDLELEDFRSRANWWKQSTIATSFVNQFPLEEMKNMDELLNAKDAYCLAKEGEVYIVYLPVGTKNAKIKIKSEKELSVKWFNPRQGGNMMEGSIKTVSSGNQSLGNPPADADKDWVVVMR
jgi:hypothetical protein